MTANDKSDSFDWSNPQHLRALQSVVTDLGRKWGAILSTPVRFVDSLADGFHGSRGQDRRGMHLHRARECFAQCKRERREIPRQLEAAVTTACPKAPQALLAAPLGMSSGAPVLRWSERRAIAGPNKVAVAIACGQWSMSLQGEAQVELFLHATRTIGEAVDWKSYIREKASAHFREIITRRDLTGDDESGIDSDEFAGFHVPATEADAAQRAGRRIRQAMRATFPESVLRWEHVRQEGFRLVLGPGVSIGPRLGE